MLRYFKYQVPFKVPFHYAGNVMTYREGIVVTFKDENGIEAFGEIAPLPHFSKETLQQVEEVLKINKDHLEESLKNGQAKQTIKLLHQIHQFPSLSFGLDTLIHDLEAKRENKSLIEYLFPNYKSTVRANGVVGLKDKKETLSEIQRLTEKGFETIKIKIGRNFEQEIKVLRSVRNFFPDLKIRVDANQAWDEAEAISNLRNLESINIEYCEQPLPAGNHKALKKVSNRTKVPVAADESVRNIQDIRKLSDAEAVEIFILKPMMIGSFSNLFVTKEISNTHNIRTVFTTSLELAVGRAAIAALAGGLGSPNMAQGLATGSVLKHDIVKENWLDHPEIIFPNQPGIGVMPELQNLTEV